MQNNLIAYLKADRQWRRSERIGHATFKLTEATKAASPGDVLFWQRVLQANGGRYVNPRTTKPVSAVRKDTARIQRDLSALAKSR